LELRWRVAQGQGRALPVERLVPDRLTEGQQQSSSVGVLDHAFQLIEVEDDGLVDVLVATLVERQWGDGAGLQMVMGALAFVQNKFDQLALARAGPALQPDEEVNPAGEVGDVLA